MSGEAEAIRRGGIRRGSPPRVGVWIPALAMRGLFAAVSLVLCGTLLSSSLWIAIAVILTAVAVARPRLLAPWALILLLGASLLWRTPSATDWRFFVLLAGLHLLHVLGCQLLVLPWRGRLQLRSLGGVLLRFLAIQAPSQLLAWAALLLFAPHGAVGIGLPALGAVAAVALVALAAVLIRPLLARSRE